ncbi:MAG TPA: hypothetical protein VLM76_11685 [Patescibacteria group bacterium]|nr:hypothetical protein [Patescibacteria group bacterium]
MARPRRKIEYTGPFFERDPARTLRQNMREAARQMAEAGAEMLRAEYAPGRGSALAPTVHLRRKGQMSMTYVLASRMSTESPERSWVSWMETGRRRRPGGGDVITSPRFKGIGAFRRVRTALRRQAKITAAELVKGVA